MLGHYDQALARTLLGDVFQTFQRQSDQLRALHHARVLEVFEGSSADQFGLWLGGASLVGLPQLAEVAAELAMIPCVERAQEGEHATIKNRIISPRHGAVLVSLARRQGMLERRLQARPGYLRELTDAFTTVRSCGDLPALLGCAMHPLVLGNDWSAGRRQIKFVQKLSSILYRCSIADQFVDLDAEQRFHERSLAKDKRDQARIVEHTNPKPPIELNESTVLVRALVGHFCGASCRQVWLCILVAFGYGRLPLPGCLFTWGCRSWLGCRCARHGRSILQALLLRDQIRSRELAYSCNISGSRPQAQEVRHHHQCLASLGFFGRGAAGLLDASFGYDTSAISDLIF